MTYCTNTNKKKAGMAMLKRLQGKENYQEGRGTKWNGKKVSSARKHSNPKCVCNSPTIFKTHEAKLEK